MTINEMQNNIIAQWGFEHPNTIHFFTVCEETSDEGAIAKAYAQDIGA